MSFWTNHFYLNVMNVSASKRCVQAVIAGKMELKTLLPNGTGLDAVVHTGAVTYERNRRLYCVS